MLASNNMNQKNLNSERQAAPAVGWRELSVQGNAPTQQKRRRILGILSILLLTLTIFAGVRLVAAASTMNDQLLVHVGNQQPITLDLRQQFSISPDILGTNVFPQIEMLWIIITAILTAI